MTVETVKDVIGQRAAMLVETGMVIGLGTGSTAKRFINHLGQRCREGLSITAMATSIASELQAQEVGIPLVDAESVGSLDLAFDGADEIDPHKRMIKGGGGALLREKIVAAAAKEMVVMVDESKLVEHLGAFPLPVEVIPFGCGTTFKMLDDRGLNPVFRMQGGEKAWSDNHHYLIDLHLGAPLEDPQALDQDLKAIPGIVETGLFLNLAGRVIIGHLDGRVEIRP